MIKVAGPNQGESELNELQTVAVALERTPKLVKLLCYLVEKHLAGEDDHLTEYNIATEVFGRKKTTFIASEDAVARVETHRLRKRLKAYYEGEGKDHPLQISIPLGTYVPVFLNHRLDPPSSIEAGEDTASSAPNEAVPQIEELLRPLPATNATEPEAQSSSPIALHPSRTSQPMWTFAGIAALVLLLIFGAYRVLVSRHSATAGVSVPTGGPSKSGQGSNGSSLTHATAAIPLRIIAGYSGPPQRDSAGDIWQADQYAHDGWSIRLQNTFIARTSDPLLFRYGRSGGFHYDIPLAPGIYELHLYFVEPSSSAQSEEAQNQAVFNVTINGKITLDQFDIVSDAMGRNVGDERVLRDISPAADGLLHLNLSTVIGTPSLSAIQILQGTPHKQLPIRIVTQTNALTDRSGQLWHPDSYFLGGRQLPHTILTASASDSDPFTTERFGHFSYAIPVDSRDEYTVVLHFEEFFFGNESGTPGGVGQRVFRVLCNGNTLLDDFDIFKEVGGVHPLTKTFRHLKPTAQGKLNLTFEPIKNYATVSAIEVFDESN